VPFVLARRDGQRRVVQALDRAAIHAGLRHGMPIAQARALSPGLIVMDAAPQDDQEGLTRLAAWLQQRIAPIVSLDPPDGLMLDTTGADHLHGGEAAMTKDIVRRLAGFGVSASVAIAETYGAAHALARYARGRAIVVEHGALDAALADLPVAALRLPDDVADGLRTLGLSRIGDLMKVPRALLTQRFGSIVLQRLDQAFGHREEPLTPLRLADPIVVRQAFAEPISAAETIARYAAKLVGALCALLAARGLGARRLYWRLERVDGGVGAVHVAMARPVRDEKHLTRLLHDRIETIDPGFGIEQMTLTALLAEPLVTRQYVSALSDPEDGDIATLIDRLANRIGHDALFRFALHESDLPERATVRLPPLSADSPEPIQNCWPRPVRLLSPPEPVETMAMLPDRPPAFFIWRGVRRRVKCADGPERVFGEWWTSDSELTAARDYFRVEDMDGQRFWLYREGDGEHDETGSRRWFLHGFFG